MGNFINGNQKFNSKNRNKQSNCEVYSFGSIFRYTLVKLKMFKTMKNKILTLILITAIFGLVSQQSIAQVNTKARAGIKGGLSASNLYVDDVHDENARIGYHIGFYGQPVSSDAFALQLELLYSTKGTTTIYDEPVDQEIQYNLNYIDLPVLAVFKLGDAVELHAGGYASYLVGANIKYEGDLADGVDEVDRDNLKSYDYGLIGGVGVNFGAVQVGARYNYGLVKIADSDAADFLIGDSKNSFAQLFIA